MNIVLLILTVLLTEIVRSTYHYFKSRFKTYWKKDKKRLTALFQKLRLIFFDFI